MNTHARTAHTPVAWRKSRYSTATGSCVEVAPTADGVMVRHSKHPTAGTITFPHSAWAAFIHEAQADLPSTNGVAAVTKLDADTLVSSLHTCVELRFNHDEWGAFIAGVADGEFDFTNPSKTQDPVSEAAWAR